MHAERYRNLKGCARKAYFRSVSISDSLSRFLLLIRPASWEMAGVGPWDSQKFAPDSLSPLNAAVKKGRERRNVIYFLPGREAQLWVAITELEI